MRLKNDPFIPIRTSYVRICRGDVTAAGLISIFEYWHNIKLDALENHVDMNPEKNADNYFPTLWQFHKSADLEAQLLGVGKRHSVDNAKKLLIELGIIETGRNPNKKFFFDATIFYLFHPEVLNDLLLKLDNAFVENSSDPLLKTANADVENSKAITIEYSTIDSSTKDNISGASAPATKKTGKKKKEDGPARPFWQRFIDCWHAWYKAHIPGEEPTIKGKVLKELSDLYDRLRMRAKKRSREWTENYVCEALTFFLNLAWSDDWLQQHFTVKNLVEQFDPIFAREARRFEEAKKSPGQKTEAFKTFSSDIQYILDRFREGQLDDRLLTPEIYQALVDKKLIPPGYREKFSADSPDLQKTMAIKAWLEANKIPANA